MFDDNFSCLINKKIIEPITLSENKTIITIKTETSTITLTAHGDCCSTSWIEHFDIIPVGETIKEFVAKNVNTLQEAGYNSEKKEYCDELLQYFYEIITDKGNYTIEMRNENNGYYGGYFNVKEE